MRVKAKSAASVGVVVALTLLLLWQEILEGDKADDAAKGKGLYQTLVVTDIALLVAASTAYTLMLADACIRALLG